MEAMKECPSCNGKGGFSVFEKPCAKTDMHFKMDCEVCNGERVFPAYVVLTPCPKCKGLGHFNVWDKPCRKTNMHCASSCPLCKGGYTRQTAAGYYPQVPTAPPMFGCTPVTDHGAACGPNSRPPPGRIDYDQPMFTGAWVTSFQGQILRMFVQEEEGGRHMIRCIERQFQLPGHRYGNRLISNACCLVYDAVTRTLLSEGVCILGKSFWRRMGPLLDSTAVGRRDLTGTYQSVPSAYSRPLETYYMTLTPDQQLTVRQPQDPHVPPMNGVVWTEFDRPGYKVAFFPLNGPHIEGTIDEMGNVSLSNGSMWRFLNH